MHPPPQQPFSTVILMVCLRLTKKKVGPWRSEETTDQLVASNWIVQNFSNSKCSVPCGVIAKEMVSLVGRRRTRDDNDDDDDENEAADTEC